MSSTPTSPILQLPAELRVRIYNYAFTSLSSPVNDYAVSARECEPTDLLQTCRQIRAEANVEFVKVLEKQEMELLIAQDKMVEELKACEDEKNPNDPMPVHALSMLCSLATLANVSAAKRGLEEVMGALRVVGVLKARSEKRISDIESRTSTSPVEE